MATQRGALPGGRIRSVACGQNFHTPAGQVWCRHDAKEGLPALRHAYTLFSCVCVCDSREMFKLSECDRSGTPC